MAAPEGVTHRELVEHALEVCGAKQTYLSETCARNAAWLINAARPWHAPLEHYQCPYCGDWHLTTGGQP